MIKRGKFAYIINDGFESGVVVDHEVLWKVVVDLTLSGTGVSLFQYAKDLFRKKQFNDVLFPFFTVSKLNLLN